MPEKKLEKIINYYGVRAQIIKAIEKLSELSTELARKIIYGMDELIRIIKKEKVERTLRKIGFEKDSKDEGNSSTDDNGHAGSEQHTSATVQKD